MAWSHLGTITDAAGRRRRIEIPSLEISELGHDRVQHRPTAGRRSALAVNLPQFRYNDTYQFQNNFTQVRGNHMLKAGFDVRCQYVKSFFFPTIRGLLRYPTLNAFVNDVAEAANINKPLPGGEEVNYYRWWDQYYFVQDEWRVTLDLTLNLGAALRAAGQQHPEPDRSQRADPAGQQQQPGVRARARCPKTDKNNFQPRLGFNWAPTTGPQRRHRHSSPAATASCSAAATRGRNDYAFLNIALNIVSSFPYVAAINRSNLAERVHAAAGDAAGRAGRAPIRTS